MRKAIPVLITVLMVMVSVTGSAVAFTAPAQSTVEQTTIEQTTTIDRNQTQANQTNQSIPAGVMLAGSIAVQYEEIQGAVHHRAFGLQISNAANNSSRARILNHTHEQLSERLDALAERKRELNESLAAGEITETQYNIEMSRVLTRIENVRELANTTASVARAMPRDVLQSHGVNVTAIQQLRSHARNMTGEQVSEIARRIAGHGAGHAFGPPVSVPMGPPWGAHPRGPPGAHGNETNAGGPETGGSNMGPPGTTGDRGAGDSRPPTPTPTAHESPSQDLPSPTGGGATTTTTGTTAGQ
ncbi:MAG: hypothetical protein ABEJ60_05180 [Halodesulfurarchaeum sp.]